MILNYKQAKELLTSQGKFYINLGLDRMLSVLELLGNPQEKIKVIHVAGTNGKGSVCAILANILKKSEYKTALYTSPHLAEYTERIKIDNIEISQQDFAKYVNEICEISEKNNIDLTEFEILTACAFKYFADNCVDFAVIETGMGGRYDATNVCTMPVCEIITSISLDHTDRLGDTIDKIAYEKAGIIKKNSTVIVSGDNRGTDTIKKVAKAVQAKVLFTDKNLEIKYSNGKNIAVIDNEAYDFPLLGSYQKQNLELAVKAAEFIASNGYKINLKEGLKTVKWNARLEYRKEKNIIIDGAHNPDAASELKKSLDYYFSSEKKIYIYSTINTKDYKSVAKILFKPDDEIYYIDFSYKNAVKFEEYIKNVPWLLNIKKAENLKKIINRPELKIITGSLYMIGEIYNQLND